jgi:late competence protein required for DNA uptake (superfamily II DNA/RNA helicase)
LAWEVDFLNEEVAVYLSTVSYSTGQHVLKNKMVIVDIQHKRDAKSVRVQATRSITPLDRMLVHRRLPPLLYSWVKSSRVKCLVQGQRETEWDPAENILLQTFLQPVFSTTVK